MDVLARLNELIDEAPEFAEAINQRAIVHFQLGRWRESIADCERTLALNPYHFGAMEGMGLCYRALDRPTEAVRALQRAQYLRPDSQELRRVLIEMRGRTHQIVP
jgi:tetratricopeptide (TPR) repeat protein